MNNPFKLNIKLDDMNVFKAKCKNKKDLQKEFELFMEKLK